MLPEVDPPRRSRQGKHPIEGDPRWRFRRTPSKGRALMNKHRGEYSNKGDLRGRLRGATPREALQIGETRDGSSEERPTGEAPQRACSEVKAWLECPLWRRFRRTAAGENAPGDMTLEIAPRSDHPGKDPRHQLQGRPSEESSPGRRPLRTLAEARRTRLQGVKPDQESVHPARGD